MDLQASIAVSNSKQHYAPEQALISDIQIPPFVKNECCETFQSSSSLTASIVDNATNLLKHSHIQYFDKITVPRYVTSHTTSVHGLLNLTEIIAWNDITPRVLQMSLLY